MKTFFLGLSLLLSNISFGQAMENRLAYAFKKFEADAQFKHALISLYVIDTKTGKPVFDKNSQIGLAPASCLKVVTSGAALELLGKNYRYKTDFNYDGNLIVTASGDPTLGSWRWDYTKEAEIQKNLAAAVKEKGIGAFLKIVIDDSKWETQATPRGWPWDDIGNYYGAGARGLNWHENQYDLIVKPGSKEGDAVEMLRTEPDISPTILVIDELKTGKSGTGDNSIIYLPEGGLTGYVRGTVPAGNKTFTVSGSMPDPANVFKNSFSNLLSPTASESKIKKELLLQFTSPPLDSINYWFLQKSVNLYGEAFVKTIAYEKSAFGSTEGGLDIIKDFWNKNGIEKSALNIIDGSGLSPANRVTTHALVTVMQYAKKQNWFPEFYEALPLQNSIKMKSGYIGGVRSYTGYIKSKSGAEYTFSFIINNFEGSPVAVREKMWKLLDILK